MEGERRVCFSLHLQQLCFFHRKGRSACGAVREGTRRRLRATGACYCLTICGAGENADEDLLSDRVAVVVEIESLEECIILSHPFDRILVNLFQVGIKVLRETDEADIGERSEL